MKADLVTDSLLARARLSSSSKPCPVSVNSLRHLLLVAVLFVAQLAAGAHAIGHAADTESGLPAHTCELCLVAHDLGSALPSVTVLPAVEVPPLLPEVSVSHSRADFPPPAASQRGPPSF